MTTQRIKFLLNGTVINAVRTPHRGSPEYMQVSYLLPNEFGVKLCLRRLARVTDIVE